MSGGESCACSEAVAAGGSPLAPDGFTATYRISNMDCATEAALVRGKLGSLKDVLGLDIDVVSRTLVVRHRLPSLAPVEGALRSIGMQARRVDPLASGDTASLTEPGRAESGKWLPLAVSGLSAVAAEVVYWVGGEGHWAVIALALVSVALGGLSTYVKGWIALRNANLNMNALMSIAVTGAMAIGHWPEAAMVMFLFSLAEVIEGKSMERARHAIRGLMTLAPDMATVRQPDGSWLDVAAGSVEPGATVRVRPGSRVPLDGILTLGRSTVDQAPITGESLPVDKAVGENVFAGSINGTGSFEYRVTTGATQSTLARIVRTVESAQASRAPTQRFVDQFARVYTPVVFAIALLVAVVPPLAFDSDWQAWLYKALVLLVIACPCALVISTPVTIVSGLAAAARKGILIKGGVYLEAGARLATLALDKTGTLTHGQPAQTDYICLRGESAETRRLAASLAARSDHPVSKAIAQAANAEGVALVDVDAFTAMPGRGVQGEVAGHRYHLGNHRLVEELGLCSPEIESRLSELEEQGKSVVMLTNQSLVLAIFAVADTLRGASREAVSELRALGVKTLMLTGDNAKTGEAIAKLAGIDAVRANLLPEDKLRVVAELQESGHGRTVGMVGDGINDAPALAKADIGFAMGAAGTDTAIETADVALMDDDLRKLPMFLRLSRRTATALTQNIILALGIKVVFLALTFAGQATMWLAVLADMGASLLVVGNGLRLLRR